ncbi:hypothetical protein BDV06DRAFT_205077 [Aspergillus oleicola]
MRVFSSAGVKRDLSLLWSYPMLTPITSSASSSSSTPVGWGRPPVMPGLMPASWSWSWSSLSEAEGVRSPLGLSLRLALAWLWPFVVGLIATSCLPLGSALAVRRPRSLAFAMGIEFAFASDSACRSGRCDCAAAGEEHMIC